MPLNAKGIHGMARRILPRSYMEYRVVVSGVVDKLTMSKNIIIINAEATS